MKKTAAALLVLMTVMLTAIMTAQAASSASVRFSGKTNVRAGETYMFTYTINVKEAAAARIASVTAGGAFEIVSGGEGLLYDTIPDNTSGDSVQGTIVVRVKDDARRGDTATLSTSGEYVVLDAEYNETVGLFYGSLIADVISGPAKPTKTQPVEETAEAVPEESPAVILLEEPSPTPDPTPTASPTPVPLAGVMDNADKLPLAAPETMDVSDASAVQASGWKLPPAVLILLVLACLLAAAFAAMRLLRIGLFKRKEDRGGGEIVQVWETDVVMTRAEYKRMMQKHR